MTKSNPTTLLLMSAMALPAIAQAEMVPSETEVQYQYTRYQEGAIPRDVELLSGARERYNIEVHQVRINTPVGENVALQTDATTETLSGASPWGTQETDSGNAGLIMSGASIREQRTDLAASFKHYYEKSAWNYGIGSSSENDYRSIYFGSDFSADFNKKNSSLKLGTSGAQDFITPSDADLYQRTDNETKSTGSAFLAISHTLSKNIIAQLGVSSTYSLGYLSDPYKLGDRRPETKNELAYTLMYRQYLETVAAALHADYRFYQDTWELQSHTLVLRWFQNLGHHLQLTPSLRYYFQTEAWFYEPYQLAETTPEYFSSDYRLSPFGAISVGLSLNQNFRHWSYSIHYEKYQADADFSPHEIIIENPALVSFTRLSMDINIRW